MSGSRLARLETRHAELDTLIGSMSLRPGANAMELQTMKRERLRLKDSITQMRRQAEAGHSQGRGRNRSRLPLAAE